MWLPDK
jgi:hypothetical protein